MYMYNYFCLSCLDLEPKGREDAVLGIGEARVFTKQKCFSCLDLEPKGRENGVLGFGEAQVFSEQISKMDWENLSHEDKLAYLKKLYRIIKEDQHTSQQNLENLGTDGNECIDPLLKDINSIPLSTMETDALSKNDTTIDMDENEM